jgi:hypothetical protein
MARHDGLSQWTACVSTNMPHLTKPQASVLALWSFGIACTRSCGRSTVATFLALLMEQPLANLEQRLYEWCLDAKDKAGTKRTDLDVGLCCVPLLRGIVSVWTTEQIALTIDASSLGDRFVVLAVCVVYRGCGIPVAWTILPAAKKRAWRREWLRMLRQLRVAIPRTWTVLVLADRGLSARWLFRRIVRLHWHPFLRINQGCKFRPQRYAQFVWLSDLVHQIGQRWRGAGTAVASRACHLDCTLIAWWGDGHQEPWFVLTDLPRDRCDAQWYGLRSWCEQAFKCTKRGGWQWQQTQMSDPRRVPRLWLAMALATLWMITLGSDLELGPGDSAPDLPDLRPLLGLSGTRRPRRLRLFRLGWLWLLVQLIEGQPLPVPRRLVPEPWPDIPERLDLPIQHQKALAYAYM